MKTFVRVQKENGDSLRIALTATSQQAIEAFLTEDAEATITIEETTGEDFLYSYKTKTWYKIRTATYYNLTLYQLEKDFQTIAAFTTFEQAKQALMEEIKQ